MAQDIFLIDKRYLVANTPEDETQNANDVKSAFIEAHMIDLVFLGIPLLDLFKVHIASPTTTTLTPVQEQLLSMVQYYTAYRVHYHLSFNLFKVTNAGVTQAPNSVSYTDLKEYRGQIDAKCAGLKKRIMEFIKANKSVLPQAAPEAEIAADNDPLDALGVVWSPNVQRYFF